MSSSPTSTTTIRNVLVTGANGYLASHIVKQLLSKGYNVHACVRNADNESSVKHLLKLSSSSSTGGGGKLQLFSTGDIGDKSLYGRYEKSLANCDAVIHTASPLSPKFKGDFDGVRDILNPGMEGTKEILDSILKHCGTKIQCLVLTSSMSAAAPIPEPSVKDESHWSDDVAQLSRNNFYGCLKTRQERLCQQWTEENIKEGKLPSNFRFVAICPTMILGPPVDNDAKYSPSGTMGSFHRWITGGRTTAPNDSMSFIHVRDCAAMHVAAMNNTDVSGRYFSLVESWHWNDILTTLKELYPKIPFNTPTYKYEGDDIIVPTQFNLQRMNSLGVQVVGVREILAESIEFIEKANVLE